MKSSKLQLSLTLLSFCLLAFETGFSQPDQNLTKDIFKELIEINTTHSVGSTTKAAEAMAARLRAVGFADSDLFIGGPSEKKGNLVVTFHGSGKRKPLLLLAHLDVVEALQSDWGTDPFKFQEKDGFYYARGSSDDKAMAAIWISNFIRLKKEKFTPDRDIIIALTADEEGGPENGVAWLLKNKKELVNAEYALNEGGGGEEKDGKKIANGIQLSEKVPQSFQVEVRNKGGHSSLPRQDNAISQLAKALDNLQHFQFPVNLNAGTRVYFERSSKLQTGQLAEDMMAILQTPPNPEAAKRLSESPVYNSLLRTTCVTTMISGGHAPNALPQSATATVNCRILPDEDPEKIKAMLISVFNDKDVVVSNNRDASASPPSPLNPEIMGPMEKITNDMWPGVPVIPTMVAGATDGAYLRRDGIPTYGVSGIFYDAEDFRAHGKDERIGIKSFYEGQEFLYRLTKALSSKTTVKRDY